MKSDLAVVDSSIIIFWLSKPMPGDPPERAARKQFIVECMNDMQSNGVRFVVPAPVITELYATAPGDHVAATVMANFGGLRVEGFSFDAAKAAGQMLAPALKARAVGESKHVIKYDVLIAAIAHALGARYLVTANARDFEKHLKAIASPVEVIAADQQPKSGQLKLLVPKS